MLEGWGGLKWGVGEMDGLKQGVAREVGWTERLMLKMDGLKQADAGEMDGLKQAVVGEMDGLKQADAREMGWTERLML